MSRRARLALPAGVAAAFVRLARGGRGARARPAREPADPRVAVRLGGGDRPGRLVRRPRRAVADPKLQEPGWRALPGGIGRVLGSRPVEALCAAIGVGLLVVIVLAGYLGNGSALDNLAPTFILIDFWVGLVVASVLFGDVFRAFSPWRAIRLPGIRPYPERWGRYPAALALLVFTWIELVSGWGEVPVDITNAAVGYTVYTLVMQAIFGTETWTRRRRGVRRLLQPVLAHLDLGDARPRGRRAAAAGRAAAAPDAARHRVLHRRDDRDRHVRRLQPGTDLEGLLRRPGRRDRRDRRARRRAEGGRDARPARRRRRDRRLLPAGDRRRAVGRRRTRRARSCAARSRTRSCRSRWST